MQFSVKFTETTLFASTLLCCRNLTSVLLDTIQTVAVVQCCMECHEIKFISLHLYFIARLQLEARKFSRPWQCCYVPAVDSCFCQLFIYGTAAAAVMLVLTPFHAR